MVSFVDSWKVFFTKYAVFKGRSTRAEYWWVSLGLFVVSVVLGKCGTMGSVLMNLISIGVLVPSLALTVRRLHDVGLSGWWYLGYFLVAMGVVAWGVMIMVGLLAPAVQHSGMTEAAMQHMMLANMGAFLWPMLVLGVIGIAGLVVMCLPSGPDNKYGAKA